MIGAANDYRLVTAWALLALAMSCSGPQTAESPTETIHPEEGSAQAPEPIIELDMTAFNALASDVEAGLVTDADGRPISVVLSTDQLVDALLYNASPDNRPDPEWLQRVQRALRLPEDAADGVPDPLTIQRIAAFQRAHQLGPNGKLTPTTRRFLEAAFPSVHPDSDCYDGSEPFFPSCLLERWDDASTEQDEFMRDVYEIQCERSARSRVFVRSIDDAEPIVGHHVAPAEIARAARALLADATEALGFDDGEPVIGVASAYRSAVWQLHRWDDNAEKYYEDPDVIAATSVMEGGRHGREAARYLARYTSARFAAPGFSRHNRGTAIDFSCLDDDGKRISLDTNRTEEWAESRCFEWLQQHGSDYGFALNDDIDEPWHWEYTGSVASQ